MTPAPLPPDEDARLRALYALQLLDTPSAESFDRLSRFAAEQLGTPIAMVTLVDRDRQWFKSRVGFDEVETARDISFCGHAILAADLFVIDDAGRDPRFADNPMVTGGPRVRFYAGAPLSAPDGHRVGTLCVIDTVPRHFGAVELAILAALRTLANDAVAGRPDVE